MIRFVISIWTSMQNLEFVAHEMIELWSVLWFGSLLVFGGHFIFGGQFLQFVWTVHINFHVKSGACSSKNDWVMLNLVFGAVPLCAITVTNLHIELRASYKVLTPLLFKKSSPTPTFFGKSFDHPKNVGVICSHPPPIPEPICLHPAPNIWRKKSQKEGIFVPQVHLPGIFWVTHLYLE